MAQFYVTKMTGALTQYCNNANIVASNELITAVCWAGLHNTTVWNELPEATKVHYRSLIASQLTNSNCN
ncbi:hypothetical protein [Flavobacterium sp.]|uniref:hypothetical protein n=1 Tax=Flavobacterium sp. TaxID=239 RepID=UPI00260EA5A7|nr:hypothetical protein [Flavobacterium sp.]